MLPRRYIAMLYYGLAREEKLHDHREEAAFGSGNAPGVLHMLKFMPPHRQQQEEVNAYFQSMSSYWKEVYSSGTVPGKIYGERQAAVLDWIESLDLKPGFRVLEIGCGAGFLAVTLTQRGLGVHAIDPAEAMVELTRRHAMESGVSELLSVN